MRNLCFFISVIAVLSASIMLGSPIRSSIGSSAIKYTSGDSKPSPLPDGLVSVDYIQPSEYGAYIDTGIAPPANADFRMVAAQFSRDKYTYCTFGQNWGAPSFSVRFHEGNRGVVFYNNRSIIYLNNNTEVPIILHRLYLVEKSGVSYSVTDLETKKKMRTTGQTYTSTNTAKVFLFRLSQRDNSYASRDYIQSFQITYEDEVLIDLVAVRFLNEDDEWEGAMYDKVSGKLFRNSGTGSFLIGPDR